MHASVKLMLRNPQTRALIGQALASKGRGGDNHVVHVNDQEMALLKAQGGRGSINPRTGLREFLYGAGTNEGGAHGFNGGGSSKGGGTGMNGRSDYGVGDNSLVGKVSGPNADYGGSYGRYTEAHNGWGALPNGPFGIGFNEPHYAEPGTYAGGTYHGIGVNPGAFIGGIGGLFAGPAGALLGPAMGWGYHQLDGKSLALTGPNGIFSGGDGSWGGGSGAPGGSPGSTPGAGSNGPGGRGDYAGASGGSPAVAASPAMAAGMQAYLEALRNGTIPAGTTFQAWTAAQKPATTPAPVPTAPAGPGLAPLMSQAPMTADAFGGRFGGIPTWAQTAYQLGMAPTNFAAPRV